MQAEEISWALSEPVFVTLVTNDPDRQLVQLLFLRHEASRVFASRPNDAFVVTFDGESQNLLINGEYVQLPDQQVQDWCSIADEAMELSGGQPGYCYTSDPIE